MDDAHGLEAKDKGPYLKDSRKKPPGWNPNWTTGEDRRGPHSIRPEDGVRFYPHEDDDGHWDHYDDSDGGSFPHISRKPRRNQRKCRPRQTRTDPWDDLIENNESAPLLMPTFPLNWWPGLGPLVPIVPDFCLRHPVLCNGNVPNS